MDLTTALYVQKNLGGYLTSDLTGRERAKLTRAENVIHWAQDGRSRKPKAYINGVKVTREFGTYRVVKGNGYSEVGFSLTKANFNSLVRQVKALR